MRTPRNARKVSDNPGDVLLSRKTVKTSDIGELFYDFQNDDLKFKRGANDVISVGGPAAHDAPKRPLTGGTMTGDITMDSSGITSPLGTTRGTFILANCPIYADNAAALLGGLAVETLYKTATGEIRIVV